jgi:hypothetical protein
MNRWRLGTIKEFHRAGHRELGFLIVRDSFEWHHHRLWARRLRLSFWWWSWELIFRRDPYGE